MTGKHSLDPYRENVRCLECQRLKAALARYECQGQELRPYQSEESRCIACTARLWRPSVWSALLVRRHFLDDRFCSGRGFWAWIRRCPETVHMHRACGSCGARWLEMTHEDTKRKLGNL